jgi:hypothetical protein
MSKEQAWPPETGVCIERLAFLAARPALQRLARPWWLQFVRGAELSGGAYTGRSVMTKASREAERAGAVSIGPPTTNSEIGSDRMRAYAFACDRVTGILSVDEQQALSATGSLPDWFLPEVQRVAKRIRKRGVASARPLPPAPTDPEPGPALGARSASSALRAPVPRVDALLAPPGRFARALPVVPDRCGYQFNPAAAPGSITYPHRHEPRPARTRRGRPVRVGERE